jgi:hypothetical protein
MMIARQHRCLGNWLMGCALGAWSAPCHACASCCASDLQQPSKSLQPGGNGDAPSVATCRYAAGWVHDGNPTSAPSSVRAGESLLICLSSNLCTCKKEEQQVTRRKRLLMDVQNTLLFRTTTVWHTCSTDKAHPYPHHYHSYSIPMLRDTTCFFLTVNQSLHPRGCHGPVLRSAPLSLV